jgi:hypothetical protein
LPEIMEFLSRLHRSSSLFVSIYLAARIFLTPASRNNSAPKASDSSSSRSEKPLHMAKFAGMDMDTDA